MAFYLCSIEVENETLSSGTMSDPKRQAGKSSIDASMVTSVTQETEEKPPSTTDFLLPFMEALYEKLVNVIEAKSVEAKD